MFNFDLGDCADTEVIISLGIAAISLIVTIFMAVTDFGSILGAWSIISHHQLLCLIPILKINLPIKLNNFTLGFKWFMFSQNFFLIEDIWDWNSNIIDIESKQKNWYLENIGVQYESTVINMVTIVTMVFLLFWYDIISSLVKRLFLKSRNIIDEQTHGAEGNKIKWHYNLYIRIYKSVFMVMVLSLTFEVYEFNPNSASLYLQVLLLSLFF